MKNATLSSSDPGYFFQLAIDQNAILKLYFLIDKCQFSIVSAPCVMLKANHFVVRATLDTLEQTPIIWGTEVNGYFTVRDVNLVHCHFSTRLTRIYNGSLNSLYLIFPIPNHIDHTQRRFSKRVSVTDEGPGNFLVWYGDMNSGTPDELPKLIWQSLADTACELAEFSSSGMRLDVPEATPLCAKMTVNDPILLKGDFGSVKKPNPIYVLGTIVRKMPNIEVEGIVSMGCQFYAWQKISGTTRITWFKPDARDGVGPIAEWISRNFRTVNV